MEKYYIPKIEEFFVGLEYEMWNYDKEIYQKYIMEFPDFYYPVVINQIKEEKLRVKYLDFKDIESLGFEYDESGLQETYCIYNFISRKSDTRIYFNNKTMSIGISVPDLSRTPTSENIFKRSILFQGIIKNKSELKRILKDNLEII